MTVPFASGVLICLPGAHARMQQPPPLKLKALHPLMLLQIDSHFCGPVTPGQGPWHPTFGQLLSPYVARTGPIHPGPDGVGRGGRGAGAGGGGGLSPRSGSAQVSLGTSGIKPRGPCGMVVEIGALPLQTFTMVPL